MAYLLSPSYGGAVGPKWQQEREDYISLPCSANGIYHLEFVMNNGMSKPEG